MPDTCPQTATTDQSYPPLNFSVCRGYSEGMAKARKPSNTAYPGPTVGMELDPDDLLRQLAYGGRRPMLAPRQRINGLFFARLMDEMSNHHTVLVRVCLSASGAHRVARTLRDELPEKVFGVHVDHDRRLDQWNVLVFHAMPKEMRVARRRDPDGHVWVGPREVARVLRITPGQASRVIDAAGIEVRRTGGRNERHVRQRDLAVLASRKGRWRYRTRKAS